MKEKMELLRKSKYFKHKNHICYTNALILISLSNYDLILVVILHLKLSFEVNNEDFSLQLTLCRFICKIL